MYRKGNVLPLNARYASRSDLEPLELTRSHMPKWLLGAEPQIIDALSAAMAKRHTYHARVGKQFGELKSVEHFCAPLLMAQLHNRFGPGLDIHNDQLSLVHMHLITDDTLLMSVRQYLTRDEPKSLLWAALQNFTEDEAQEGGINPLSLIQQGTQHDQPSSVKPFEFAEVCRTLDLGLKYQRYLQQFLGVADPDALTLSAEQSATQTNLQLLKLYDMQVDAHIAFLNKKISESAYKALTALLVPGLNPQTRAAVQWEGKPLIHSSLSILDTRLDGIIVFSSDTVLMHPDNRLIIYIPNDPKTPFCEYSSLAAMTGELRFRLLDPTYQAFFTRFIALTAKPAFLQRISAHPEHLFLTTDMISVEPSDYLVSVQLKNMFADARQMAVPTGVIDATERERLWQLYKSAGLILVNVAALFVPTLGALMLAAATAQMLGEVFEGVESWSQGDTDHAREHFLNVAKDIALTATVVVGAALVNKAVSSLSKTSQAFFDDFEPVLLDDGSARLWSKNLQTYETHQVLGPPHTPDAQGLFTINDKVYVEVDGKPYQVTFDNRLKQWRIVHPHRATAFKPALLHNEQGAWQHVHERPLEWQGSSTLVGRLGRGAAALEPPALEQVLKLTDTSESVLRRVHLDNTAPPVLLSDTLKRFEIDRKISRFAQPMGVAAHGSPERADMQLSLLPLLPGWPQGKSVQSLDALGRSLFRYGNKHGDTTSYIDVPHTAFEQGTVLDTVLNGLSPQERQGLQAQALGNKSLTVHTLAHELEVQAQTRRGQLFEALYERLHGTFTQETEALAQVFPGLPPTVVQHLVKSANEEQIASLRAAKVPLTLAEYARLHLHDVRLHRAFEGFYLKGMENTDTITLIEHYSTQLPSWPQDFNIEVREYSVEGKTLGAWGDKAILNPIILVKGLNGYQRWTATDQVYHAIVGLERSLPEALFFALPEPTRRLLGFTSLTDAAPFSDALAKMAVSNRVESARVLGMQPINTRFRAPNRLADGRIGYSLCGLGAARYEAGLQRRVRDLYPHFNDEQVLEYLENLVGQGLDPLSVIRACKRERKVLVDRLQVWVDASEAEMLLSDGVYDYAESRYEAAKMILQSWRMRADNMPWAVSDRGGSLNLSGLRVGNFPLLPANVNFNHIHELKLSNMNCKDTADPFLSFFPNLRVLEMDNNQMVYLPSNLQRMPHLKRLSLARNLLYLTREDVSVFKHLRELEVLNLNDNLTGPLLDFDALPKLRRVSLRRTLIDAWPRGLITRPLIERVDLRDNAIQDIPEYIFQMPAAATFNISLSGNPLSMASRLRLARSIQQGGSSMGIRSEELMDQAAAFEFWTSGITELELRQREKLWNQLREDPAADDFFDVLSGLTSTADAQTVRQDLSRRVWEVIEIAAQNSTLRRDLFEIAASPRSCSDSVAVMFSALEVKAQLAHINDQGLQQKNELIALCRGLFRLEHVHKISTEHYKVSLEKGGVALDELEVHLAYRIGLAKALDLPGQPWSMQFRALAGVSQVDLDLAKRRIEIAENTAQLQAYVSTRDFWRDYLITHHKVEFSALTEPYYEELSDLLVRSPDMSSERYLGAVSEVRRRMEVAIDTWCLKKTNTYIPRTSPITPEIDEASGST